eukprot:178222-Prorocentrum_minimum.AAC.1
MTSNKTVEFLKRAQPVPICIFPAADTLGFVGKAAKNGGIDGSAPRNFSQFIGTHREPLPTYPSMYKRRMPGDIGWNVQEGERGRKNAEGESISDADSPLTRHCKIDGIGTLDAHQKVSARSVGRQNRSCVTHLVLQYCPHIKFEARWDKENR